MTKDTRPPVYRNHEALETMETVSEITPDQDRTGSFRALDPSKFGAPSDPTPPARAPVDLTFSGLFAIETEIVELQQKADSIQKEGPLSRLAPMVEALRDAERQLTPSERLVIISTLEKLVLHSRKLEGLVRQERTASAKLSEDYRTLFEQRTELLVKLKEATERATEMSSQVILLRNELDRVRHSESVSAAAQHISDPTLNVKALKKP
jgi:hypothetical protein